MKPLFPAVALLAIAAQSKIVVFFDCGRSAYKAGDVCPATGRKVGRCTLESTLRSMTYRHLIFAHTFSVAVIFLLLVSSPLLPQSDSSFTFIQLSDPQFGMYPFTKNFAKEKANMAKAVEAVNRLKPAFVVITGDLVNAAGDTAQTRAFQESIGSIDRAIPVHLVPGNHDVGNRPSEEILSRYRRGYGQDYYSFSVGGVAFIVLNSSLIKYPHRAPASAALQKKWITHAIDSIAASGPGRTITFIHHPPFLNNVDEPGGYGNIDRAPRRELLAMLEKGGTTHVFAGHLHYNASTTYDGMKLVASGPVGMALGTDPSGLRIVTVTSDSVVHRYYGLEELTTLR